MASASWYWRTSAPAVNHLRAVSTSLLCGLSRLTRSLDRLTTQGFVERSRSVSDLRKTYPTARDHARRAPRLARCVRRLWPRWTAPHSSEHHRQEYTAPHKMRPYPSLPLRFQRDAHQPRGLPPHRGDGGMSGIAAMIFLMIALFLYFIPAIIALDSKLLNSGSVLIVNTTLA
jgi:hypothetical protein